MLTLRNAELQAEAAQRELQALRGGGGRGARHEADGGAGKSSPKPSQAQLLGLPNDSLLFDITCDSRHYELPRTVLVPIPKISTSSSLSGDRGMCAAYKYKYSAVPCEYLLVLFTIRVED